MACSAITTTSARHQAPEAGDQRRQEDEFKRRPSMRRPRTVLRTMRKGAANTRRHRASAAALGLVQQLEARQRSVDELIAAEQPCDGEAERKREQHM